MSYPRGSRHERGYGTAWDKLRLVVLKRDCYLCQCEQCFPVGRITSASEVDHIIPKADFASGKAKGNPDDMDNLRAINKQCHKRVSMTQRGYTPHTEIGIDGWAVGGAPHTPGRR